jgi:large subunit ribosomal protein L25
MEQMRINASIRRRQAKGDNRKLRREGLVPAVIYGGRKEPINVTVNDHEVELILRGAHRTNAIFNLAITDGEGQEQTIIREVQRHPVTSRLVHMDFQRIDLESEIEVSVAIHVVGSDPKGVKAGGILEHLIRAVAVRCTPLNIPKYLEADLSNLDLNQSFHVRELALREDVQVMVDPDTALFTILPPKAEAEPVVEAVAAMAAEPELIGGKKPEGEEAEEKEKK